MNNRLITLALRRVMRSLSSPLFAVCLLLYVPSLARAQQPLTPAANNEPGTVALSQALLDLTNPWTVMCVAAHPDDEDGATLTLLRRKYGVHTVSLFSTYGEGGQNATGPELYEELGAIRARETTEAAAIQGSEPFFLGLRDFGFSKSADEAFRVWGHTEALRRMVLKIRELRPDVIITNHDTVSGHGHHQATGRLVLEAFDAAADPTRFPEQLRDGIGVWQAQRLFIRINYEGGTGSKAEEDEAQRKDAIVSINTNERDPVRHLTYAEQALQALHRHATQGPWPQTLPPGGARIIRYRLAREAKKSAPLPPTAPTILDGLRLPDAVAAQLTPPKMDGRPLKDFVEQRARVLDALIAARLAGLFGAPESTDDAPRFHLMLRRLDHALAVASGITATLARRDAVLVPGRPTTFSLRISNNGDVEVRTSAFFFQGNRGIRAMSSPSRLLPKQTVTINDRYNVPPDAVISVPHSEHLYDGHLFGEQFSERVSVKVSGVTFRIVATTQVDVAPAVEIQRIKPSPLVLTPATINHPSTLAIRLVNHRRVPFVGRVQSMGTTSQAGYSSPVMKLAAEETGDTKATFLIPLTGAAIKQHTGQPLSGKVQLSVYPAHSSASPITQRAVPVIFSDATIVPRLRVGYVRSSDDTLRDALGALGVESTELAIDDVRTGDLRRYDAIIIDNRGYQAHPELIAANARLLDYAREGGTLIVFYHKANEWNPDPQKNRPQLAPYPIILGNERVTDENSPVTFSDPQNALLNSPNKINQDDFQGWIQERGLYYPKQWDAHYSAPLATSDAGEQPLRGGLLATDYGRGRYIYTSMVWYRQLRAGVPGAYRIFANMLSYGRANRASAKKAPSRNLPFRSVVFNLTPAGCCYSVKRREYCRQ